MPVNKSKPKFAFRETCHGGIVRVENFRWKASNKNSIFHFFWGWGFVSDVRKTTKDSEQDKGILNHGITHATPNPVLCLPQVLTFSASDENSKKNLPNDKNFH